MPKRPEVTYNTAGAADRMAHFVPHAAALGMTLISSDKGHGVMSVSFRDDLIGDPETGVIASGVVTALIDHTCGLAIGSASDSAGGIATLDLRIDYLRPAAPGAGITVEANCYRVTRSIGFVRAQCWDVDPSDPVATAQAAFMLNARG